MLLISLNSGGPPGASGAPAPWAAAARVVLLFVLGPRLLVLVLRFVNLYGGTGPVCRAAGGDLDDADDSPLRNRELRRSEFCELVTFTAGKA